MNTRLLTYFVKLVETKNFTRAAEQLHIAQPALSVAIKKLEQQLDLPLFHRNERKVTLTHEGEVLLVHARLILQQISDANIAMAELKGFEKGEVKLGVPSMLGSYFFPEILMAFKRKYPNLKLTIIEAGTQSIRQMLLDGELDLGVIHNEDVPQRLETEHLVTSQMVAVVSERHPLASQPYIKFEDFFKEDLVMFKAGYFHREFIDEICEKYHFKPKISFETNLLPMMLNIVRHDFSISALLELVTEHENGVVAIPFEEPVHLNIAMAWRKNGYLSLADRAFLEFVNAYSK
ncbi:LysR family transcriptional regulator [Colwellia psychrerythraea]|jgi:DNA-binding transcriptional LysR family regulator|uniref:Substrate-binding transcriptional regulator, LysR family n=1 Tax=Colwellia psychrerythraea (strain 34H / ATCC BAA-681) TaxID=167879 RepID=Q480G4_COLP3|nr:LysR family transcriptional regulator [Colwellia psychrerythraea]AAZ27915.1 substrate-binding transcriptional regulator, LysR family [Colwellia psychrerythraea 34H]